MIINTIYDPIKTAVVSLSQTVLPRIAPLVALVATPQFRLLQGLGICSYGIKEIFYDSPKCRNNALQSPCKNAQTKWNASKTFFLNHGSFFLGCGIAGTAVALHSLEAISVGPMLKVLKNLDLGLFLAGCVVALRHYVRDLQRAQTVQDASRSQQIRSAILGIVSSLSYLIWCSLLFFEFTSAITFIFCAIGLLTGCWKILFDFFTQKNEL